MGRFFIGIMAMALMLVFATGLDQWLIQLQEIRYMGLIGFIVGSMPVLSCVLIAGVDSGRFLRMCTKIYWTLALLSVLIAVWSFMEPDLAIIWLNITLGPLFNLWCLLVISLTYLYLGQGAVRLASILSILVIGGGVLYEAKNPGFFSVDPSRAAGFSLNPNTTCERLTLLLPFALPYGRKSIFGLPIILTAFAIVFMTQSRGGLLIIMAIGLMYYVFNSMRDGFSFAKISIYLMALVFMAVAGYFLLYALAESSFFADNIYAKRRLDMILNPSFGDFQDDSRTDLAHKYLSGSLENPIVGHGTASSSLMENYAHNMFLRFFYENGVFVMLLYVYFVFYGVVVMWRRRVTPSLLLFLTVLMNSVFSHNMIENRTFAMAVAFAGLFYYWSFETQHPYRRVPVQDKGLHE